MAHDSRQGILGLYHVYPEALPKLRERFTKLGYGAGLGRMEDVRVEELRVGGDLN